MPEPDPDILTALNFMYAKYRQDIRFDLIRPKSADLVPGEGPLDGAPNLIFVGEAPGATEANMLRPFVGRSGELLELLIFEELGLVREDVYLTNLVKYWPGKGNPDPWLGEMEAGLEYLRLEIKLVSKNYADRIIVSLGRLATMQIMMAAASGPNDVIPLGRAHGKLHRLRSGFFLFPMYHPSWGLRGEANREVMRKDFATLRSVRKL